VSYVAHMLTTEADREQFHAARRAGGLCAACGRTLSDSETVYIERFASETAYAYGPVGIECTSEEFRSDTQGQEPERCAGCGRGVFYRLASSRRRRALCSRNCANRAERRKGEG
jgi:hypothetical protein